MGLAGRAQGARRRRCGAIVDNEQRRDRPATPMRPKGSGGAGASAVLELLDDVPASPASLRLASAPAALGTRRILILGQAPSDEDENMRTPIAVGSPDSPARVMVLFRVYRHSRMQPRYVCKFCRDAQCKQPGRLLHDLAGPVGTSHGSRGRCSFLHTSDQSASQHD
jgi:hypothetical protein